MDSNPESCITQAMYQEEDQTQNILLLFSQSNTLQDMGFNLALKQQALLPFCMMTCYTTSMQGEKCYISWTVSASNWIKI